MHQSQENLKKKDRLDIRKMLKYTAKKILWLINYSLSFSKKDKGKEIGIKILGCIVIIQSIYLLFFIFSSLIEIIFTYHFLTLGFLILIAVFIFKKEIKFTLKLFGAKRKKDIHKTDYSN